MPGANINNINSVVAGRAARRQVSATERCCKLGVLAHPCLYTVAAYSNWVCLVQT